MRKPLAVIALALLCCASCAPAPKPQVSVFSGKQTVRVSPLQYCAVDGSGCTQQGSAAAALDVDQGAPLQISVDEEIADTPWRVEYRVLDDSGRLSVGCSGLFAPGKQYSFRLVTPAGQHLQMVNVYQLGARLTADQTGVEFGVRGTWTVLTAPNVKLPKPGEALCPDVPQP